MGTILSVRNKYQQLKTEMDDLVKKTIEETNEQITDLNAQQLSEGLKADGSAILPEYSALTIQLKKEKSGLAGVTDFVTLYDTGEHYKGLFAVIKGDQILFGSKDSKSKKLQDKYGDDIYGLGGPFKSRYIEETLRLAFIRNIKAFLTS